MIYDKPQIIIIVSPGKSGSEYLRRSLNSSSNEVLISGEVFNQSNIAPGSFNY